MKKIIITIALLCGFISAQAQIKFPSKPQDKTAKKLADLNKDKFKKTVFVDRKANTERFKKLYAQRFRTLTKGTTTGSFGYRQLKIVDANFIEELEAHKSNQSKKKNGTESCTSEALNISANTASFNEFSIRGAADWMKPGVILKGSQFINGRNTIVTLKRNPITISSNLSGNVPVRKTIVQPEQPSKIQSAVNSLRSRANSIVPANLSFTYKEIHSVEELGFNLTGKYSNSLAGIKASLGMDYDTKKEYHYYMIDFYQNMFSIDVDPKPITEVFKNKNQSVADLIYVSRVNYGRRGIVIVKSKLDFSEFKLNVKASLNTLIHKGSLKAGFNTMEKNTDFEVKALFYGGSTDSAISSMVRSIENGGVQIESYLRGKSGNARYALPISYQLKNMHGETLGLRSVFKQNIRTCVPTPLKEVKLRVTLTDLLCINGRDGGSNPDDYGLISWVDYKAKGKKKKYSSLDIVRKTNANCKKLVCGDKKKQIHVKQSRTRTGNINNSMVFKIKPNEFLDSNASFKIYTWLKEYTGSRDKVLENNSHIKVPIKTIITYLLDPAASNLKFNKAYYDSAVLKSNEGRFYEAGNRGQVLWLKKASRGTLEGPIRLGNSGEKAATWFHFELID